MENQTIYKQVPTTNPDAKCWHLTKREYFAAIAMQGLISSNQLPPHQYATLAVAQADKLIEELNKGGDDASTN